MKQNNLILLKKLVVYDVKLYCDVNYTTANRQQCLDNITIWSHIRQLKLSSSECSVLYIGKNISNFNHTVNDTILPQSTCSTDLSVYVDHLFVLMFILKKCKKAKQRSALILVFNQEIVLSRLKHLLIMLVILWTLLIVHEHY